MNAHKVTEQEIDTRLNLDRNVDQNGFCRNFYGNDSPPANFYQEQDTIRDGLERTLNCHYENGDDWNLFFMPADFIPSERIIVEISNEILANNLIQLILNYLKETSPGYCVIL